MVLVVVDYWRKVLVFQAFNKNTFGCGSCFLCILWGFPSFFLQLVERHTDLLQFIVAVVSEIRVLSGFVPSFLRNTQPASKRQALNIILSSSLACKCMGCINRASEGVVSLISLSLFYPKKTTLLLFYRLLSSSSPFSSLHIAVATKPRTKNSFLLCFCCSTFCGCNKEPGCKSWRGRRSSYKVVHT